MLRVSPLVGFGGKIAGGAASLLHCVHAYDAANASSWTHSSVSLGTGTTADRWIVVTGARDNTDGAVATSVTVDGVSCTMVQEATSPITSTSVIWCAVWECAANANSTGDVVVNVTAGSNHNVMDLYRLQNFQSSTPHDTLTVTDIATPDSISGTLDIPSGGCALMCAITGQDATGTSTLTGITKRAASDENSESRRYSVGDDNAMSGETGRTMQADWSATQLHSSLVAVSWL